MLDASVHKSQLVKEFGKRDRFIIHARSPYEAIQSAIQHPQDRKAQKHASFVIWNYARKGRRKPALFTPKAGSIAMRAGSKDPTARLMAVRCHMGPFPLRVNDQTNTLSLRNMKMHALMRISSDKVS